MDISKHNALIEIMIEYILTNGTLPGFKDRLKNSLPYWEVCHEPFIVYRGQGHSKKGISRPEGTNVYTIKSNIRPVISTSKFRIHVYHKFTNYEDKKKNICCLFEISVEPGIRFLDFSKISSDEITEDTIKDFIDLKKVLDPDNIFWPTNRFPPFKLLNIFKDRKIKESEILLDGFQGTFKTIKEEVENANNLRPMKVIHLEYTPKNGGKYRNYKTRKNYKIRKYNIFTQKLKRL